MKPLTITVDEFCRVVGVGRTTAYALLKTGEIARVKSGRRTLILVDSVEHWIERCTVPISVVPSGMAR